MVLITDNNNYSNDSKCDEHFKLFSYELSPFQKHAIRGIVDGNHVLVTAATGSGKTLPAEFAIRHFTNMGKRVIYCSPIKALSNQKTFDFTKKYPDITFGLLTGDIKTNPTAQVLIMTTEILMNRLFMKSESKSASSLSFDMDIENELGCVIFDELHYINDAHRGHVWEQSILMLPQHVSMVMLSATLDDPMKFANWVESRVGASEAVASEAVASEAVSEASIEPEKQVVICSTDKRVVPLTHYIYNSSPEGLFKKMKDKDTEAIVRKSLDKCLPIRSAEGVFNETTYKDTRTILNLMSEHGVYQKRKPVLNNLLSHLRENEMLPAICFIFSRKAVEQCAEEVTVPLLEDDSKVSYTVKTECESIIRRLPNWREYEGLPEYQRLVKLLEKGIGIHHSGMIPILREIVEFMISKKYIKVLFATESFAIGLDCPIKTAIFVNLKKYDGGEQPRYLLSHEYTQMAGRAGRRGIDTVGHVVHCANLFELPDMNTYKEILCGKPQKLISKFKIYYSVALNIFKSAKQITINDIEDFVKHSMYQCELNKVKTGLMREQHELIEAIVAKDKGFEYRKTSRENLKTYRDLLEKHEFSASKKRKEIDISIRKMKAEHANLEKDYVYYCEYIKQLKTLEITNAELHNNENHILNQINNLLMVLLDVGVIESVGEEYRLTEEKGVIASSMAEINPILIASVCKDWNYFEEFTTQDLVSFFSLFVDVRVNEESRVYAGFTNYCDNEFINTKIKSFEKIRFALMQSEDRYKIYTNESGLDGFCYDLVDIMEQWCKCKDESQCKMLLSEIEIKGISVGDFTKAVLKISTLSREMIGMCEATNQMELMNKLVAIDGMILKFVTTNQSLYL